MLSIIIPTKNEEKNLPKLLASIKMQTLQPKEVIVSDAQSTDQTRALAKEAGAIVVEGGKVGHGRNTGAKAATGDLLLFLDADVVLPNRDFLHECVTEFTSRGLAVAGCDFIPISDRKIDVWLHAAYNHYTHLTERILPHAGGAFIMATREVHEAIGGFDESMTFCEDHMYVRAAAKKARFGILRSTRLPMSVRRLDKDGRLNILVKFTLAELHLIFLGPIRDDKFNYTFDHKQ